MPTPALVLVHGGGCAADCWELTIGEIHRLAPELTVLAPDLPGRRGRPGDSKTGDHRRLCRRYRRRHRERQSGQHRPRWSFSRWYVAPPVWRPSLERLGYAR